MNTNTNVVGTHLNGKGPEAELVGAVVGRMADAEPANETVQPVSSKPQQQKQQRKHSISPRARLVADDLIRRMAAGSVWPMTPGLIRVFMNILNNADREPSKEKRTASARQFVEYRLKDATAHCRRPPLSIEGADVMVLLVPNQDRLGEHELLFPDAWKFFDVEAVDDKAYWAVMKDPTLEGSIYKAFERPEEKKGNGQSDESRKAFGNAAAMERAALINKINPNLKFMGNGRGKSPLGNKTESRAAAEKQRQHNRSKRHAAQPKKGSSSKGK